LIEIQNTRYTYNTHHFLPGPLCISNAVEEKKKCCASAFSIACQIYNKCNKIKTSRQHQFGKRGPQPYDVSSRTALGAIDNGIGYSHVYSFLTTLNVTTINRSHTNDCNEKKV